MGSPAATRRRRSVDESCIRGTATRTTRQPSGSGKVSPSRSTIARVTSRRSSSTRCHDGERGGDVAAHHEHELAAGCGEVLRRVDRVGGAIAVELDPGSLEADRAVERGGEHLVAGLGRRNHTSVLLPRIAGRDHQDPVESQLVAGGTRVHQMAHVNWIEGAAEDPDLLAGLGSAHRASLRRTLREPRVTAAREAKSSRNLPA